MSTKSINEKNTQMHVVYSDIYDDAKYGIEISSPKGMEKAEANIKILCAKGREEGLRAIFRREILMSAESYAISAMQIEGINHEYASIPGVIDQIPDIINNIKKLMIVGPSTVTKQVEFAKIDQQGPYNVKASDIILPAGFSIINEDQHICTIDAEGSMKMQLAIIYGFGFRYAHETKYTPALPADFIKLDTNFAKDINVSTMVDDNFRSNTTGLLTLKIETSPLHDARQLFAAAAKSLYGFMQVFVDSKYHVTNIYNVNSPLKYRTGSNEETLISDLVSEQIIPARLGQALEKKDIKTIQQLSQLSKADLIREIPGIGAQSIPDIEYALSKFDLKLQDEDSESMLGKKQVGSTDAEDILG